MEPKRIQLKRTRGWKMPPNTVKVDRSTMWGNPFDVSNPPHDVGDVVEWYRWWLNNELAAPWCKWAGPYVKMEARRHLRGKNLACWCKEGGPCHADVLLEIANSDQ